MKKSVRNEVLTAVAKTIKGTSFIGIRNYENSKGEVSNQTILVGFSTESVAVKDFLSLQENHDKVFFEMSKKDYTFETIKEAYTELYESLEKRLSTPEVKEKLRLEGDSTILRADAQKDAYEYLAKGIKLHKETQKIHIFGMVVNKTILVPIEYKAVKSAPKTLCKNDIKKLCNFKEDKMRNFVFDKAEIKLQGIEIK